MRPLFALALVMLIASSASAQPPERPNEFFLGVGDAGLIFEFEEVLVTVFSLSQVRYGDEKIGVQFIAGYQRHFNSWASAGVTTSWAGSRRTVFIGGADNGEVERRLITVVADGRAHWLRRPNVRLYSGLALGYAQLSDDLGNLADKDALNTLAFHIIPVGVRVGRDVGGFFEVGAGWHGFFKAGLSGRW